MTEYRSVSALRQLADYLESLPADSAILAAANHTLSCISGGEDHHRMMWLLLDGYVGEDCQDGNEVLP